MKWTEAIAKQKQADGKIRSYKIFAKKKNVSIAGRIVTKHFKKKSKEKNWIALNLLFWCNEHGVTLQEEYHFHQKRKWRFDWCIDSLKIAVEYEGIFSEKSRHTTISGYTADVDKYNAATVDEWKIIRLTAKNYKTIIETLNAMTNE